MSQSKASFISQRAITVPAGDVFAVNVYGRAFVCRSASGAFEMRWDEGEWFDCGAGVFWSLNPGDSYERLSFRAAAQTEIKFLAGNFDWRT